MWDLGIKHLLLDVFLKIVILTFKLYMTTLEICHNPRVWFQETFQGINRILKLVKQYKPRLKSFIT